MSIRHRRSAEPGNIPEVDELVFGQIGINYADGKLFIKRLDGAIVCVGADVAQFGTAADTSAQVTAAINGLIASINILLDAKEPTGAAAAALAAHTGEADPHSQYASDADLAGLSTSLAAGLATKEAIGAAAASITAHVAASHPHAQYLKAADVGANVPWGIPGAIGNTTPNTGKFISLNITSIANNIGPETGALICFGGAYFARNTYVGAQFTIADTLRHKGPTAGFFNAAPINRPTVHGSRGSGAALISLIKAVKDLGLINDSTTA